MKRLLPGCIFTAGVVMLAGCHTAETAKVAAPRSLQARVVESRRQDVPVTVRASGTIHARESATISPQVSGRIERMLVREGDTVRAGQALVVLDAGVLGAAADQASAAVKAAQSQQSAARAEANLAASTLERYRQLQAEKSVSAQELDEVSRRAEAANARVEALHAQSEAAQAQEAGARAMLGYTTLRAPFAGVVTARLVDPGSMAAPGVPLLQVDSAGPLQLLATVDESAIGAIHTGMKVQVNVGGAADGGVTGTVAQMAPAADSSSRTFTVKIDLPAAKTLKAGIYGTADFPIGVRQAVVVPRSGVVQRGSLACAYVLDAQGVAQLRYLTLGRVDVDSVEVLSGIAANERLVDRPADRDLAGVKIEVQP